MPIWKLNLMWFSLNTVRSHALIRDVAFLFQKMRVVVRTCNALSVLVGCVGHVASRQKDKCTTNRIQNVSKKKIQFYRQQLLWNWFRNIWDLNRTHILTLSFAPNALNVIQSIRREVRVICWSAMILIARRCSAIFATSRLVVLIITKVGQIVMLTVSLGTIFDEG
jgi:hypothetical protein